MTLTLLVLAGNAFAGTPCPDLAAQAERGMNAIVSGDAATLDAALTDARQSVTCAAAQPAALGAWWLVEAARARTRGEDPVPWLQAVHGTQTTFDGRLGPELRRLWEGAATAGDPTAAPLAQLTLEPALVATLDGANVEAWPRQVGTGMHLVQVHDPSGAVVFARMFALAPGEDALIETGLPPSFVAAPPTLAASPPVAEPAAPATPAPSVARRNATWIVAGAVLASAGGSFAVLAHREDDAMRAATSVEQLDAAYARQQAWAWSALALATAGAASATAYWFDTTP